MEKEKIGLLGGTFNPIHVGHLKIAEIAQKTFHLDKVLFIPSSIPPHKGSIEAVSPAHRLKMVELAVSSSPRFVCSSIEIDAKGTSYSVITLNKIKKIYPDTRIFFILGIDAFLEITTWKDYKKVLRQCSFIIVNRPGYRLNDAKRVFGGKYIKYMVELSKSEEAISDKILSFKIFIFQINAFEVSSTEIRERIKRGDSIKGMVSEAVENYIKNNKFYQRGK
ncbi:nicotinate-nucleotide adenylyltransferase [Acidobacteriota bacterium]